LHAWSHGDYIQADIADYFAGVAQPDASNPVTFDEALAYVAALPDHIRCGVEAKVLRQWGDFCASVAPDEPKDAPPATT